MKEYEILLLVALYLVGVVSGYTLRMDTENPIPQEEWALCFDAPSTQETFCGSHRFDDVDSCVGMRDWLREIIQDTWSHTDHAVRNHRCNRVKDNEPALSR